MQNKSVTVFLCKHGRDCRGGEALLLGEVPELVEGPTPVVMEPKGGSRNEVSSDPGKPFAKKTAAKKFSKYSLCCIKTKILL